jgi:hypothetical protein
LRFGPKGIDRSTIGGREALAVAGFGAPAEPIATAAAAQETSTAAAAIDALTAVIGRRVASPRGQ